MTKKEKSDKKEKLTKLENIAKEIDFDDAVIDQKIIILLLKL